ncbi:hypothetical protein ANCCEY_08595 [Ancylostoma ceylanicum]|uniref:Uncharacterized protein n=1 Tax=Ancylostoma ceylanicum TaxID=53326 RepID=A0A0D6LXH0_9BILA|nr:hypothetical protein ANCCEY_08595 [Ancylostoma ceylanicum]
MRVKKCPTKIVVAEVEGSPLAEASASSRLSFAGRVASAAIKKYEQDDDDMPERRRDVHMEETEFLKWGAAWKFWILVEGRKSEVMQPAAKRRKKGFVRPVKPNGALNATKKIDGILKQRVEFAKLWQSRLRSATAVQSDAKAKQPVPPIRANNAGKRSSPKSPKILQSSTQRKGQGRSREHPAKTPVVAPRAIKCEDPPIRERSHRNVKPVERYGVATEQRQPRKRKKSVPAENVKEKKKTGQKKPFCKAQGSHAGAVPKKRQKLSAKTNFPCSHAARLPRQCRKDCAAHENVVVDRQAIGNKKGTVKQTLQNGSVGDGLGTTSEDLSVETGVVSAITRKKESPQKHAPAIKTRARETGYRIAKAAEVPQRKVLPDRKEKATFLARGKVTLTKEQERDAKRAAREEKRRMKLEEQQRKREARRLKKELREKLLKEKRERREAERRKQEEERLARKKKKGSVGAILDEIASHRYGVAAYLVVENTEEKTQGILYAQDVSNPFAGLPEEVYFLQTYFLVQSKSKGKESIMRVADCAEVLFYMMVDMLGLLTWRGLEDLQIMVCKEGFVEQNRKKLPVPLIDYWKVVRRAQAIDTSKFHRQDDYLLLDGMRGGATVSVQRLVQLFQEAEFLRYKLEVLRADYDALMTRKEFMKRNAAQTKRERALATRLRHDPKDQTQDRRDAADFSSEDSDDE